MKKIHSEQTLRRRLYDMGYILHKSRARHWSYDNQQGYMLVDMYLNIAIWQSFRYDLTLEEIDDFVYGD